MAERVHIYDTTLRDGMQREGISLSVSEKLQVAHLLDRLGCGYIEAGFPASNPKDWELFEQLEQETFQTARVAAFGMTRRKDVRAADDESLRVLVECFAPVITLVGKTWDLHLDKVVRVTREENLAMIGDSVRFCVEQGKEVVYDAEHFFDAYAADRDYALRCLTNGGRGGRRQRDDVRHQRRDAAGAGGRRRGRRARGAGRERGARHPHPQRRGVRRRELAGRRRRRRAARAGHDERLRRALRQREPDRDHPEPRDQARLRVHRRRSASRG